MFVAAVNFGRKRPEIPLVDGEGVIRARLSRRDKSLFGDQVKLSFGVEVRPHSSSCKALCVTALVGPRFLIIEHRAGLARRLERRVIVVVIAEDGLEALAVGQRLRHYSLQIVADLIGVDKNRILVGDAIGASVLIHKGFDEALAADVRAASGATASLYGAVD